MMHGQKNIKLTVTELLATVLAKTSCYCGMRCCVTWSSVCGVLRQCHGLIFSG